MLSEARRPHGPWQAKAVRRLLAFRLDSDSQEAARARWLAIVEGQDALWTGVSQPYKHTIRAFLVHFHTAILRHSTERFNFQNGSVGALGTPIGPSTSLPTSLVTCSASSSDTQICMSACSMSTLELPSAARAACLRSCRSGLSHRPASC